jgi:hypothetical protein
MIMRLRREVEHQVGEIGQWMTHRQHLMPHESVARAVDRLASDRGLDAERLGGAVCEAGFDVLARLGRLRRNELERLSRVLGRALTRDAART